MVAQVRSRRSSVTIVLLVLALANVGSRGEARPKYKTVFERTYPRFVEGQRKITCNLCHAGDDKKKRNHYGEALAKELKKNETDEKTIEKALKAIEDGSCKTGKWKPRLENAEPPCTCGNRDHAASAGVGAIFLTPLP